MSRSYRKVPIAGITTAVSEKDDKRLAHRRLRARERHLLSQGSELYEVIDLRDVSDPWCMAKDGKHFHDPKVLVQYGIGPWKIMRK